MTTSKRTTIEDISAIGNELSSHEHILAKAIRVRTSSFAIGLVWLSLVGANGCGLAIDDPEAVAYESALQIDEGGDGKKIDGLKAKGYTCTTVAAGFIECTKEGAVTYWCDSHGDCEPKPFVFPQSGGPGSEANVLTGGLQADADPSGGVRQPDSARALQSSFAGAAGTQALAPSTAGRDSTTRASGQALTARRPIVLDPLPICVGYYDCTSGTCKWVCTVALSASPKAQ